MGKAKVDLNSVTIHAGKLSQTPRRGGFAGRRAGVLATGKPRERERASLFARGRLAGARGDAEDVVRQTTEALLHCCLN